MLEADMKMFWLFSSVCLFTLVATQCLQTLTLVSLYPLTYSLSGEQPKQTRTPQERQWCLRLKIPKSFVQIWHESKRSFGTHLVGS